MEQKSHYNSVNNEIVFYATTLFYSWRTSKQPSRIEQWRAKKLRRSANGYSRRFSIIRWEICSPLEHHFEVASFHPYKHKQQITTQSFALLKLTNIFLINATDTFLKTTTNTKYLEQPSSAETCHNCIQNPASIWTKQYSPVIESSWDNSSLH